VVACSGPLTQRRPSATAAIGSISPAARIAALHARPTPRIGWSLAAAAARAREAPNRPASAVNVPVIADARA
jgi:hypothetical protein